MTAKSSTERTRAYRRRLVDQGKTTLSTVVACDAHDRLHRLSKEHGQPLGRVIELGALLAERKLQAMAARTAERAK